jgi:hypothetical protein
MMHMSMKSRAVLIAAASALGIGAMSPALAATKHRSMDARRAMPYAENLPTYSVGPGSYRVPSYVRAQPYGCWSDEGYGRWSDCEGGGTGD